MADALVFDMPMELCLKPMAIIGSYFANAEGEFFDDIVDEISGRPDVGDKWLQANCLVITLRWL